jgi:hypothetical protein
MKLQTVYESNTYNYFKKLKGPYLNPEGNFSKKEWEQYVDRCNDLAEVKKILSFLRANMMRASNRGDVSQKISVTLDYVYKVGSSQNFHCALTGEKMEFERGGDYWLGKWCNPNSCTIDRVNSTKGYVEGNIQLVTWKANCIKQHLNNKEFIDLCKSVARFNK